MKLASNEAPTSWLVCFFSVQENVGWCFKDIPGPDEVLDVIIRNVQAGGICGEFLKDENDCDSAYLNIHFFSLPSLTLHAGDIADWHAHPQGSTSLTAEGRNGVWECCPRRNEIWQAIVFIGDWDLQSFHTWRFNMGHIMVRTQHFLSQTSIPGLIWWTISQWPILGETNQRIAPIFVLKLCIILVMGPKFLHRSYPPVVKEKSSGPEVTEQVPGNYLFDKFRGLDSSPKIFAYLPDDDGKCLQTTCLYITYWAETQLRLVPFVETDLEQAMQYRLWGPYHGYPVWRWYLGKGKAPCNCKCHWFQHHSRETCFHIYGGLFVWKKMYSPKWWT